jgi:hypothetical protein
MLLRDSFKRKFLFFLWMIFLFFLFSAFSQAEAADKDSWKNLKTKYVTLKYKTEEDLKAFNRNIKFSPEISASGLNQLFSEAESVDFKDELKKKIDSIFKRVQEILDMRKQVDVIKVNIYHNKKNLHEAFFKIYKKKTSLRGWYIFEYNTIYMSIDDMHAGMLAHEMAHSIIDHYLSVRPPSATAEILARYVDSHLLE